jgi:hypothetical protein
LSDLSGLDRAPVFCHGWGRNFYGDFSNLALF